MNAGKYVSHLSESHHCNVNFCWRVLEHVIHWCFFARCLFFVRLNGLFSNAREQRQPCVLSKRLDLIPLHHTLSSDSFLFFSCFLFLSFCLYLCCLFLLLSRRLSLPPPPLFSLTPFLWLAVSLGLCTFQAGNSEALSKHQLPRSAQWNPSWPPLRCRPPCLPTLNSPSTAFSHIWTPRTPPVGPSSISLSLLFQLHRRFYLQNVFACWPHVESKSR